MNVKGDEMPNFLCAVADCKSDSRKNAEKYPYMAEVKGWARFPSAKKEPQRRKLWENRCRREGFAANKYHRICSRHFVDWIGRGPSSSWPDPQLFQYNDWGRKLTKARPPNAWQVTNNTAEYRGQDQGLVLNNTDSDRIRNTGNGVGLHGNVQQSSLAKGKR